MFSEHGGGLVVVEAHSHLLNEKTGRALTTESYDQLIEEYGGMAIIIIIVMDAENYAAPAEDSSVILVYCGTAPKQQNANTISFPVIVDESTFSKQLYNCIMKKTNYKIEQ